MRDDKVQCQCCGKWMVPRPLFSRRVIVGGWSLGGGKLIGNICPFCLTEEWDGSKPMGFYVRRKLGTWFEVIFKYLLLASIPLAAIIAIEVYRYTSK